MAPITRENGNRYANLHGVYEHEKSVHGEQEAAWWQQMEEQFENMRDQVEALTIQLSNMGGHNRHYHQTPLHISEEEDGHDDGYESGNPFAEL